MSAYQKPEVRQRLEEGFRAAGKKLDMGQSCIRFRTLQDLAVPALEVMVASTPPDALIESYAMQHPTARTPKGPSSKATTRGNT